MKVSLCVGFVLAALFATEVSAQTVNLTGKYQCVQNCSSRQQGARAYVTQNGSDINLVNEAGQSSRAWIDVFSPTRVWAESWNEGAVYSPDGMTLQFDRGETWQRDLTPTRTARRR